MFICIIIFILIPVKLTYSVILASSCLYIYITKIIDGLTKRLITKKVQISLNRFVNNRPNFLLTLILSVIRVY